MERAGRTLDVLIKVDVGFHRCGIDPDGDALGFVQRVSALPGLRLRGLLSHAGHGYHASSDDELRAVAHREAEILTALRDRAAKAGIPLEELSVGATPTLRFSAGEHGLTELRPGNYVYFDRTQLALGSATLDDCALTVLSSVVTQHDGPHHPRRRQQDADERSGARHHGGTRVRRDPDGDGRLDGAAIDDR